MLRKCEHERLHALASRVARLIPSRRDPEAFHEEKSEIAHDLRTLADTLTATRTERPKP